MSSRPWKVWRRGQVFYVTTPDGRRLSLGTRDRVKAIAKRDRLRSESSPPAHDEDSAKPAAGDEPSPGSPAAGDRVDDPLKLVGADAEGPEGGDTPESGAAGEGTEASPADATSTVADVATDADIDAAAEELAYTMAAAGCLLTAFAMRFFGREAGEPSQERADRLVRVWKRQTRFWVGSGQLSPWVAIGAAHVGALQEQWVNGKPAVAVPKDAPAAR